MVLPPGTLFVYVTEALSSLRYTPKKAPQYESAQVFWVPLWSYEKFHMANKVCEQPRILPGGLHLWIMYLS